MSWPETGETIAIVLAIALFIWVSIRFGIKQAFASLILILSFVASGITGGASTDSHTKWSESQRRALRNYAILIGFALATGTVVFLAIYLLKKTLDF